MMIKCVCRGMQGWSAALWLDSDQGLFPSSPQSWVLLTVTQKSARLYSSSRQDAQVGAVFPWTGSTVCRVNVADLFSSKQSDLWPFSSVGGFSLQSCCLLADFCFSLFCVRSVVKSSIDNRSVKFYIISFFPSKFNIFGVLTEDPTAPP